MPNGGTREDHLRANAHLILADLEQVDKARDTDSYPRWVMFIETRFGAPVDELRKYATEYAASANRT